MKSAKTALLGLYGMLFITAVVTIYLTSSVDGYDTLLTDMTIESGFFEWVSVILLGFIFVYGMVFIQYDITELSWFSRLFVLLFSTLSLLAVLEELSWGQHLFHFASSDYFVQNNMQQETNLHNLMPAEIFSSLVYFAVYAFFIFMPILKILFPKLFDFIPSAMAATPHVILIALFASSFQAYFYDDFGGYADTVTLIIGMILFGVVLLKQKAVYPRSVSAHYFLIVLAIILFMSHYTIFGFFNAQYEIREMFVVLAALYWFIELTQKLVENNAAARSLTPNS